MLQSRSLTSAFRQQPLQAYATQLSRRLAARPANLLKPAGLAQRSLSSNSAVRNRLTSRPSWRIQSVPRSRGFRRSSDKHSPSANQEIDSEQSLSLSGRFKQLSRKYGWSAVGVYFALSVLDFPFCFLAVRLIGPERIGEVEHAVVDKFWSLVSVIMPSMSPENRVPVEDAVGAAAREAVSANGNGHRHHENASIWTQLLLAYGVHKSLIFFRIPLTAAVTPKIVKTLRSWGWNIGNKQARSVR